MTKTTTMPIENMAESENEASSILICLNDKIIQRPHCFVGDDDRPIAQHQSCRSPLREGKI